MPTAAKDTIAKSHNTSIQACLITGDHAIIAATKHDDELMKELLEFEVVAY